jgi:hypothetical protein
VVCDGAPLPIASSISRRCAARAAVIARQLRIARHVGAAHAPASGVNGVAIAGDDSVLRRRGGVGI